MCKHKCTSRKQQDINQQSEPEYPTIHTSRLFFCSCLSHWKRTDHQIQGKILTVKSDVDQVQSSAFLKLMIAAAVCSFVSNISCLIVSTVIMEMVVVEQYGTIYFLSGQPLLANQQQPCCYLSIPKNVAVTKLPETPVSWAILQVSTTLTLLSLIFLINSLLQDCFEWHLKMSAFSELCPNYDRKMMSLLSPHFFLNYCYIKIDRLPMFFDFSSCTLVQNILKYEQYILRLD